MTWYGFFRMVAGLLLRGITRTEVVGRERVPRDGPFILVANHQSILDPIIVQVHCPRPLHTLTKSTQFNKRPFGWLLPRINALPTRRYRVDSQVVRMMLSRLAAGHGVGVYPEGERSWDARLQPFRRGTIRVLLKAGVPVVPCGVVGSYDVWPRWSRRPRRHRVRLEFGEPIRWPGMDDRAAREAFLPEAAATLRRRLDELSRWEILDVRASRESEAESDPAVQGSPGAPSAAGGPDEGGGRDETETA
jgi:1-acyl-sn-glycerol-3-phosphate acyltransferase